MKMKEKDFDYCRQNKGEQKRAITRLRKLIEQIKALDLESEIEFLEKINNIK